MDEQFLTHEYRTGNTQPQKNRNGLVAVLLMCVIFLAGVVSAMGVLNIRLLGKLEELTREKEAFVSFADGDGVLATRGEADRTEYRVFAGITLQELPLAYRQMYSLPEGLYVSSVAAGSGAEKAGIVPGDVLIAVDGVAVCQLADLGQISNGSLVLTFCRNGKQRICTLPLEE